MQLTRVDEICSTSILLCFCKCKSRNILSFYSLLEVLHNYKNVGNINLLQSAMFRTIYYSDINYTLFFFYKNLFKKNVRL